MYSALLEKVSEHVYSNVAIWALSMIVSSSHDSRSEVGLRPVALSYIAESGRHQLFRGLASGQNKGDIELIRLGRGKCT